MWFQWECIKQACSRGGGGGGGVRGEKLKKINKIIIFLSASTRVHTTKSQSVSQSPPALSFEVYQILWSCAWPSTAVVCHCVTLSQHLLPFPCLNLSTPLCIRWELGLLGARWLLPEVMVFSGTSNWSVHFQCRGGSSFKLLRGLGLPNIST